MPVLEALETIACEKRGARVALAIHLRDRVKAGATLAEAIASHEGVSAEDVAIIEAGERSGTLVTCLERIVERIDRRKQLVSQLFSRAAYPIGTLVAAVVLLPLYLIFLGNKWAYVGLEAVFFIPIAAAAFIAWRGRAFLRRKPGAREPFERFAFKVPLLGSITLDFAVGKASWLLGTLLESGLPFDTALPLAAKTSRSSLVSNGFRSLEPAIRSGKTLTEALELFPAFAEKPSWTSRIAVAEKTGHLGRAFRELGTSIEDGANARLGRFLKALPYILLPMIGALILIQALKILPNMYGGL